MRTCREAAKRERNLSFADLNMGDAFTFTTPPDAVTVATHMKMGNGSYVRFSDGYHLTPVVSLRFRWVTRFPNACIESGEPER